MPASGLIMRIGVKNCVSWPGGSGGSGFNSRTRCRILNCKPPNNFHTDENFTNRNPFILFFFFFFFGGSWHTVNACMCECASLVAALLSKKKKKRTSKAVAAPLSDPALSFSFQRQKKKLATSAIPFPFRVRSPWLSSQIGALLFSICCTRSNSPRFGIPYL